MLEERPNKEDWYDVRFSDEVYFGYSPTGTLRIIRKPGQRECPNYIQHVKEPRDKDKKVLYYWAAVGYNFKSSIIEYDSGNKNRKMTQEYYIQQLLNPIVKKWIDRGNTFVLEEDGDSGHGPGHLNIVRKWKEENGLSYYFNCPGSPDLAPIEKAWKALKEWVRKVPYWDNKVTRELI